MAIRYVFRFDGFTDFDEGWIFDNAHGCDICEITVEDVVEPEPPGSPGALMGIAVSYYEGVDENSGVGIALYDEGLDQWTLGGVAHGGSPSSWPNTLRVGNNYQSWFGTWWQETGWIYSIRVIVFQNGSVLRTVDLLTDDGDTTFSADCYNCMDMDEVSGVIACAAYIWTDAGSPAYKWVVFVSEDMGATWKPRYDFPSVDYTVSVKANVEIDAYGFIWVSFIETNGDVIYTYKSEDNGTTFNLVSTLSMPIGTTQLYNFRHSIGEISEYQTIISHTIEGSTNVLHLYTSEDGAQTWSAPIDVPYPGTSIVHYSYGPNIVWLHYWPTPVVFQVSNNSGVSFTDITPPIDLSSSYADIQGDSSSIIWTDSIVDTGDPTYMPGFVYSIDGGQTWTPAYIPNTPEFSDIVFTSGAYDDTQVDIKAAPAPM